eukprot:CAMPEP_0118872306 /NCGR_PEP_ID=MMETSP1163-20130328/14542_1 /TAXON_ID=124430 /ORGANISM="Phaeomonas parva, Strain CCMP2877" /LENGTH=161 /DNA_ID=CAMNT_0006807477 /DNA_START=96 /DNA_END=581 /DNA_ORIENTATION=+
MIFLLEAFKPRYWWFELFEAFRRVIHTVLPIFFERGSVSQLMSGVLATAAFMAIYASTKPFARPENDVLATLAQGVLFLILTYSLAAEAADSPFSDGGGKNFGILCVVLNVVILASAIYAAYLTISEVWSDGRNVVIELRAKGRRAWAEHKFSSSSDVDTA